MVNASKILTVSYGTFSCTLEGFDDPFSTMRSIAEYFRDLAADDRYFGAEPPTPDAEMLHRIAEREVQRRVEARVQDNGVVLRQMDMADAAPPQPAIADAPAPPAVSKDADAAETTADTPGADTNGDEAEPNETAAQSLALMAVSHADAPGAAADVEAGPMDAATNESVAEKLRRIRAAVARSHAEPLNGSAFVEDEHANPLHARSIDAAFADSDAPDPEPAAAETAESAEADTPEPQQAADETAEIRETPEDAAAEPTDTAAEADSAVAPDSPAPQVDDASDDGFEPEADADDAGPTLADIAATFEALDAEDSAPPSESREDTGSGSDEADAPAPLSLTVGDAAKLARRVSNAGTPEPAAPAPDAAELTKDEDDELDLDALFTEDAAGAPADAADTADTPEQASGDDTEDLAAILSDDDAQDETADPDETRSDAPVATTSARARLVKMSREDFMARFVDTDEPAADAPADEASAEAPDRETPGAEAPQAEAVKNEADDIRSVLGETGLSAEDEDDLISELVALERDGDGDGDAEDVADAATAEPDDRDDNMFADDTDDAGDAPAPVERSMPDPAPAPRADATDVDPAKSTSGGLSVDRLLAQADSELKDNDSSRRRSAIAHLKAAVAAVRADGGRVQKAAAAEEARAMNQYRDDLAHVVRPEPGADPETAKKASSPADEAPQQPQPAAPRPAGKVSPQRPAPAGGRRTERPDRAPDQRPARKMAPLMLVSEQRIDNRDTAAPAAGPVRPRRVQTADLDVDVTPQDAPAATSEDDFAAYVREIGAEGLQELLEASAAFGTLIEGAPFNSRPQIMSRMLRHQPEGSVSREEGLRAFGVLLREGRIRRIQRGQFVLAENSRLRPAKKSVAG